MENRTKDHIPERDYVKDIVENQSLDMRGIFQKDPRQLSDGRFNIKKEKALLLKSATGYSTEAYLTKFLFAYLGGLIYARKEFIPSFAYFTNSHYNWIKASKYIVAGYLVGCLFSTFNFGHPFLLEDYVRTQSRSLTHVQSIERQNSFRYINLI